MSRPLPGAKSMIQRFTLLVLALLLLSGCSSLPTEPQSAREVTLDMLLEGAPVFVDGNTVAASPVDLLAMTPEMKAFVDFYVDRGAIPSVRLRQLQSAIIHNQNFRVNYTNNTLSAAETFARGYGNCLSFTNMFIAMARYLNLDARYQEVDIPPHWQREADTLVLSRHVNVHVRTSLSGNGGYRQAEIVDFNAADIRSDYKMRQISDTRALAIYFSNIGVDHLQAENYKDAFAYLRAGLDVDPRFHDLWVNLGALYSRLGVYDYAERAYLEAVRREKSMIGLSNLARIYEFLGHEELAAVYTAEVKRFRLRNPYWRYYMAQSAIEAGLYDDAVDHLEAAIRLKPEDDSFYFLLGVVYLQQGKRTAAESWFEEAQELAEDAVIRRRYDHKIQRLLGDTRSAVL